MDLDRHIPGASGSEAAYDSMYSFAISCEEAAVDWTAALHKAISPKRITSPDSRHSCNEVLGRSTANLTIMAWATLWISMSAQ